MPNLALGIDFGTGNSRCAVFRHHQVEMIPDKHGNHRSTPSRVTFTDTERLVGSPVTAAAEMDESLSNTVFDVKRLLGRIFDVRVVQENLPFWPFSVVNSDGHAWLEVAVSGVTERFSPEEIAAVILRQLKKNAEAYLREEVTDVVITVPAAFSDAQRQAVKDAGRIAGLRVLRIISEPCGKAALSVK